MSIMNKDQRKSAQCLYNNVFMVCLQNETVGHTGLVIFLRLGLFLFVALDFIDSRPFSLQKSLDRANSYTSFYNKRFE